MSDNKSHLTYNGKKDFKDVPHFVNKDGHHIFCRYYKPSNEPKALMIVLHGYDEHCGRFECVAQIANSLDILMFTHDHVSNGESEGHRGSTFSYKVYVRDILQHIDIMKKQYPNLPVYLYGHSMGGGLAIATAQEQPDAFAGVILTGAYIKASADTATPFKIWLAKVVATVMPGIVVGSLKLEHLSRSPEAIKEYQDDPMAGSGSMTCGVAREFLRLAEDLSKMIVDFKLPVLIMHGEDDSICDVGGSKLLHEVCKSEDKTLIIYPQMKHMVEHELEEDTKKAMEDLKKWLSERLP